jgi:hypothetical protein
MFLLRLILAFCVAMAAVLLLVLFTWLTFM